MENDELMPHLTLRLAVLVRAVSDAHGQGCSSQERREAVCWLQSNETEHPFSFLAICEVFNICPKHVREQVVPNADLSAVGMSLSRAMWKILGEGKSPLVFSTGREWDVRATAKTSF